MGSSELIGLGRALHSEGDRGGQQSQAGSLGVEPRLPQVNKGRVLGAQGGLGMFEEELFRVGSWGQCPEPPAAFKASSTPCPVQSGLSVSIGKWEQ